MMKIVRALCLVAILYPSLAHAADVADLRDLMIDGCTDEVRMRVLEMLHDFEKQGDAAGEGTAWLLLGVTDANAGDLLTGKAELEEAEARFSAMNDLFGLFMSNVALATAENGAGHLQEALAIQERGLAAIDRLSASSDSLSLASMRILAPMLGAGQDQLRYLEAMPALLRPILIGFIEGLGRCTYAGMLIEADELEKAERELERAQRATLPGVLDGELFYRMGELRERQWRLEEARESYLKARDGAAMFVGMTINVVPRELSILEHLADLDLFMGRVDEALAWNDSEMKLVVETHQSKLANRVIDKRAELLEKAGRYEEADALADRLIASAKATANLSLEASVEADLAGRIMVRGTYGTAARHAERAIALYQQLHEPYLETTVWILLSEIDMHLGLRRESADALDHARPLARATNFQLASAMIDAGDAVSRLLHGEGRVADVDAAMNAIAALPDTHDPQWSEAMQGWKSALHFTPFELRGQTNQNLTGLSLLIGGKTLLDRGELAKARATWLKALDSISNPDLRAGALALIGASYSHEGRGDEAIRYFKQSAAAIEAGIDDVKVEEMLAGYLGADRHFYFDVLIDSLVGERRLEDAFAQSERARSRAFLQMVGNHRLNGERGGDEPITREAEILRKEIVLRERRGDQAADLARLRDRYQTLLTRVKTSNPEYASLTNVEPLRLQDVQNDLAPDTTLISYFVTFDAVHVWVIEREGLFGGALPLKGDQLRRLTCWAGSLEKPRGASVPAECADAATADVAYNQLIAPIRAAIHHRKLIIIPHGVLHYVPFAALHDAAANRDLLDDFTITYAPSASALRFLRAKESPVDGNALVLGDPATTTLPRLPGAAAEATAIARILGTRPHLGAEARRSLLTALHGKTDFVHLAGHGIYDPANPLFSHVALADTNLTVEDILASLDLTGVNLVVLSACRSAVGARSGGDDVVGLTRALLYAGTPGVISTLWNIDDAASAGLMEEFYRRLTAGASAAEALRDAQLAVKRKYPDPRYWAAFTLTGDPQGRWSRR